MTDTSPDEAVRQAVANSRLEGHLTPDADLPLLHAVARGEVTADEAVVLLKSRLALEQESGEAP